MQSFLTGHSPLPPQPPQTGQHQTVNLDRHITSLFDQQGVFHTVALPFTSFKNYLKAKKKKNYGNLIYFTMQN
jgi:hypothetical protein